MEHDCVSVIIPCYNDGAYIMDAVESIRRQTYPWVEMIVVDDGSDDLRTIQILEALRSDGVCVLQSNHTGPAAARNVGIRAAKGPYILPLDSDDRIEPTFLEKAVAKLREDRGLGVVYSYARRFGKATGRWEVPAFSVEQMLLDNVVFATGLYYRKDWERAGGYDEGLTHGLEDYDFWLSMIELGCGFYQIPEELYCYRVKKTSRTSNFTKDVETMRATYRRIYNNHRRLYREHADEIIPALRDQWVEDNHLRNRLRMLLRTDRFPGIKRLVKGLAKRL